MKYFDVHQHYNFMEYRGHKVDINGKPSDFFEKELIKLCKKLDMVVAINGYGRCDHSLTFIDMNDEVEKFFKNNPDYIIGLGYIDLDYDVPPIIDKLFKKGFKGVKIIFPEKRYDHKSYSEFYKRCEHFNMPILFHTGVCFGNHFKEFACSANMQPIYLESIGYKYPKLKIIGAHLGYAYYSTACAIVEATKFENNNIYFDISGSDISFKREIPEGGYIKKIISVDNLLWGLDEPFNRYEEIINIWKKYFQKINLTKEEQDRIFFKNACEIFGLKY
jgi:predicted TIM-barrel fold metal-dependent hydrolase